MGGSWPRPRRLKDSWEYLYRGDGGGERGAGGVCRGKSYQENHGGAASPLASCKDTSIIFVCYSFGGGLIANDASTNAI